LPLIVVGIALIVAGTSNGGAFLWIAGAVVLAGGLALFASGKRL
jgi:hypothetical protein